MSVSLSVSVAETSYSIANNTSVVKIVVKVTTSGVSYNQSGSAKLTVQLNGSTKVNSKSVSFGKNKTRYILWRKSVMVSLWFFKTCRMWCDQRNRCAAAFTEGGRNFGRSLCGICQKIVERLFSSNSWIRNEWSGINDRDELVF